MNLKVLTHRDRALQVDVTGNPDGTPVFLLHGTPGGRMGPKPRASTLYRQGVRLISYDRPGYGGSDRLPGRRVVDAVHDVSAIADHLKLDRFVVVGRSGGGPHALACAARLAERVSAAAALVPIAPRNAPGLDWFAGMTADNVRVYRMVGERYYDGLRILLQSRSGDIMRNPEALLPTLDEGLEPSDRWVIGDSGIRGQMLTTYREALVGGADSYGWFDDVRALGRVDGWGFDPAEIKIPVLLWHGSDDHFSPLAHTRWLADRIHHARLEIAAAASHFSAVPALPEVLSRVLDLAEPKSAAGREWPARDRMTQEPPVSSAPPHPRPLDDDLIADPLRESRWPDPGRTAPDADRSSFAPLAGSAHAASRHHHPAALSAASDTQQPEPSLIR